jgi:HEAT repeat protein
VVSGKRKFEEQMEAMDRLTELPLEECTPPLRKALTNRSNFIVGRAADLIRRRKLTELTPELLDAFNRFFEDPGKSDPQCWAKNAIAKALAEFEHPDAQVYLRGMKHIQLEPSYGGASDSAATLRATCALAVVQCRSLTDAELLRELVDLLADKDKTVRAETIRAIGMVGGAAPSLLLRERAVLGSDEPEVLSACYSGILHLEGVSAIAWVSRFLASGDDAAAEAALAIAETHSVPGFEALRKCYEKTIDMWFRSVLLSAIALTRQDAATEFLLDLIGSGARQAEAAIEAVLRSAPSGELIRKLEALVADDPRLARALAAKRNESS